MSLLSMPARMMAPARVRSWMYQSSAEHHDADAAHEQPVDGEAQAPDV